MAMHMKNEEKTPKKKSQDKRGFYVALAICAAAIGIAAWSTYDTMSGFLEPADTSAENSAESAVSASEASAAEDDPEATVSEGHAQGTASEVEVESAAETVTEAEPEESISAAGRNEESAAAPVETEETPEVEETAAEPAGYTVSERFVRPVGTGAVIAAYSDVPVYSETMRDYRVHLGTDYQAEHGETVKAAANGIVKETYTDMLLGNTIVIEHGDVEIRYCGLGETFLVDPGEIVSAGQDIGSVTAAPFESAMESHLHLEVTKNGEAVDPETLFA